MSRCNCNKKAKARKPLFFFLRQDFDKFPLFKKKKNKKMASLTSASCILVLPFLAVAHALQVQTWPNAGFAGSAKVYKLMILTFP